jgi:Response regulator receiver domain
MNRTTVFGGALLVALLSLIRAIYYAVPGVYHVLTSGSYPPMDPQPTHIVLFVVLTVLGTLVARSIDQGPAGRNTYQEGAMEDRITRLCVLVVGHHPLACESLRRLLEIEGRGQVKAQSAREGEVLQIARNFHPDLTVLDMLLPSRRGIEVAQAMSIHYPAIKVGVISIHDLQMRFSSEC